MTATLDGPASTATPGSGGPGSDGPTPRPTPRPRRAPQPRRPREFTPTDIGMLLACIVSAFCLNWLIFARLTDGAGWFGFALCTYVSFLVLFYLSTKDRLGRLAASDRVATVVVLTGGVVLLVPLVLLVGYVIVRGLSALRLGFFVHDQSGVTPVMDATAGGGAHAVLGTIEQVGLAVLWSLPLSIGAAVFLNESRSRWRRPVHIFVDAMSGLPSIIAGLFIYAVLILPLAKTNSLFGFNGFMASLALAMIMIPTVTQTVVVVLRLVPDGLREASLALGSSRARTVWSVVFPTARTGMTTAVVLGLARIVGETAPLLFTAFGYDLLNSNPFDGPQESLPLFVYRNIRKPDVSAVNRGFAGALVLMIIVFVLFAIARVIGRDQSGRGRRRASRPNRSNHASSTAPSPSPPAPPSLPLPESGAGSPDQEIALP